VHRLDVCEKLKEKNVNKLDFSNSFSILNFGGKNSGIELTLMQHLEVSNKGESNIKTSGCNILFSR
jgi:hypothetical protein